MKTMRTLKNYEHFSKEYRTNESTKLNENIFSDFFKKVGIFFKSFFGKHAWVYYALYLQKKGKLPKGIDFICPPTYAKSSKLPSDKEIEEFENQDEDIDNVSIVPNSNVNKEKLETNDDIVDDIIDEEEVKELEIVKEKLTNFYLNEKTDVDDFTSLDHPESSVRNVDVEELKHKVIKLYNMNTLRANRHKEAKYDPKSEFIRKKTHALFIWGAPGIGKTEILHQVAKELDIAVIEWHLSQIEPTDFRGIPKIENIEGSDKLSDERTVWKLPTIFPTSNGENGKGGIMFFDEMNRAPSMVLGASLSLALNGRHGGYVLPSHWIVIAAGNRAADFTTGDLTDDTILWNRFQHINFSPKPSDWLGYAKNVKSINPKLLLFIEKNPEYYHRLSILNQTPNWTSPRTWEMASEEDYFERGFDWKNKLPYNEVMEIYEDFVGYDTAKAFVKFLKELDEKERLEAEKKRTESGKTGREPFNDLEEINNKKQK